MSHFSYLEEDLVGLDTLQAIANAKKFNRWMYDMIKDHLRGDILEIGSGIGNISQYFLQEDRTITLTDVRNSYVTFLTEQFSKSKTLQKIIQLDLVDPLFDEKHQHLFSKYDSAFALNVIEHIEMDNLAIKNLKKLVKPGGTILILVPAYQILYNAIDQELQHYRRYTANQMKGLLAQDGWLIDRSFFFNAMAIPAWWLSGAVFRNKTIKSQQMNVYDQLVPVAKMVDKIVGHKIGLSLIVVARNGNG